MKFLSKKHFMRIAFEKINCNRKPNVTFDANANAPRGMELTENFRMLVNLQSNIQTFSHYESCGYVNIVVASLGEKFILN